MKFYRFLASAALFSLLFFVTARAQNGQRPSPEQQERQMLEYIDREVQRLSDLLDLEIWQEFYVDSTLNHDFHAMYEELNQMQQARVGNADLYQAVQDRWMQSIDDSYRRFFTEEQWKKYWKSGGKRAQAARDKRARRRNSQ